MSEQQGIRINNLNWDLSVGIAELSRSRYGISRARHCNTGYEVTVVLQGNCLLDVEDSHYTLSQGQAVIIAPGRYHSLRSLPGEFDHFTFRMTPPKSGYQRHMKERIPNHRVFPASSKIPPVCRELFEVYRAKGAYWQDMYSALLKQLVLLVLQSLRLDDGAGSKVPYRSIKKRTSQIYEFVNEHLGENVGIEALARKMGLSSRQAKRVLQSCTGMGFREVLLNARMDRSQYLLRTTDKTLSEIAGEGGYASDASFYRAFGRHFAMTPGEYRRLRREKAEAT